MKTGKWKRASAAAFGAVALVAGPASADTNSAGANLLAKGKYAQLNALPDWSGVWNNVSGYQITQTPGEPPNPFPLKPVYAAKLAEAQRLAAAGTPINDPSTFCVWPGMPRLDWQPYGLEFLFTPGRVTILWTIYSSSRRIYTDGRKHPADLDTSYNGHSIGHWEGDTLVVHTAGLRDDSTISNGVPHSDKLEVSERWRLVGPDRLEVEMTMVDPEIFTRPYVARRYFERKRDWDIGEYSCEENNRGFEDKK